MELSDGFQALPRNNDDDAVHALWNATNKETSIFVSWRAAADRHVMFHQRNDRSFRIIAHDLNFPLLALRVWHPFWAGPAVAVAASKASTAGRREGTHTGGLVRQSRAARCHFRLR